jgi:glycosyltransferase involved in cell wall biosynthesis
VPRLLMVGPIWQYHGGGARLHGLATCLPECGWEPVVLTQGLPPEAELPYRVEPVVAREGVARVARGFGLEPEKGIRRQVAGKLGMSSENRALKWATVRARELLDYPDAHREWRRKAIERGRELCRVETFDAIISTSPPVSSHLVACELKSEFGMPWVADFPHLWSQDHGVPYGAIRRAFDRRLERRTLAGADALVTTNQSHADTFAKMHGEGRVSAIMHGFDPATVNDPPVTLARKFTLTYTGGLSRGVREPRVLLDALAGLIQQGVVAESNTEVRLYGPRLDWVQEQIDERGLSSIVTQCGSVPQATAFARQRESHVLVNIKCDPRAGGGILSSKVLEYLAARRPILSVGGGPDPADDIVEKTGTGVVAADVEAVRSALEKAYAEYVRTGTVVWHGNQAAVRKYSQQEMARRFADLLDGLVQRDSTS